MKLPKIEALAEILIRPEQYGRLALAELFTPIEAAMVQEAAPARPPAGESGQ